MKPNTTHKNPSVQMFCSAITNSKNPRRAPATAMGIETMQLMKTKLALLKLTILLCFTFATTAVFGQAINWTNTTLTGLGADIGNRTNWDNNPTGPGSGTAGTFSGTVPGPMNLTTTTGIIPGGANIGGGYNASGFSLHLTSGQTSPVTLTCPTPTSTSIGFNTVTIDSGAGQLTLGDNTLNDLDFTIRPTGATIDWVNNSTSTAVIGSSLTWQAGGAGVYTIEIDGLGTPGDGTGNWAITNRFGTHNSTAMNLYFLTSGTVTWNAPAAGPVVSGTVVGINSPVVLNWGCKLILKTNNLLTTQAINNNSPVQTALIYDGGSPLTLSGIIGGSSASIAMDVQSGTLTLSGANVFTGDITNSGGKLVAGRAEGTGNGPLGVGGIIHLNGGTFGWSLNNGFDYSSRFSTDPGQVYNFDTGGSDVTMGTALNSTGGTLTKSGNGSLILSGGGSYSGATTVNLGKLIFQGPKSGTGSITVGDGTTLGAYANGTQIQPSALTLGTSSGVTLEFSAVNSTVNPIIAAGTLSSPAGSSVLINIRSGTFAVGNSYPLFSWTTGTPPGTQLGILNGFIGNVSTNGNKVQLNITGTAYTWTGLNNNSWDLATGNNWQQNGGPVTFANNFPTLLDDSTVNNLNITNSGVVTPGGVTVNNNTNVYQITSSVGNGIGGTNGLNKQGTNVLSLNGGNNTYTGVTTLSAGIVTVGTLANGGTASDIGASTGGATNLVFDGGTLLYTNGTTQIDRLFTVTTGGGTIDASGAGPLQLTNTAAIAMPGSGTRTLILTGSAATNNTFAPVIPNSTGGATSLTKGGVGGSGGEWDLIGNNTYSGLTTVNNGVLRIGQGTATGSLGTGNTLLNGGTLIFNRTNSLTYGGAISGGGAVIVQSGTVTLSADNNFTGGTSISNGATLNVGSGGATGGLAIGNAVVNNGMLVFNSSAIHNISGFNGVVSGTGNIEVKAGKQGLYGANSYTGWTLIDSGATLQISQGNEGSGTDTSVITNNGTLLMLRQDYGVFIITNNIVGTGILMEDDGNANDGDVTLRGTNTYTGGTRIGAGHVILGDGITPGAGSIVGDVNFTNSQTGNDGRRLLMFNRPDSFTFPGNITGTNNGDANQSRRGQVQQNGTGVVTLTGANTYLDGTIVSNGVLQVGNGGTIGTIGTGNATVTATLVFNRSDALTFSGGVIGTGLVAQAGSGTLTLSGAINLWNTNGDTAVYTAGTLAASNGTLVVTGGRVGGNVNVSGGMLSPSAIGTIGSMALTNAVTNTTMNISSGGVLVTVNKSLAPSNSVIMAANGNVVATGGTVKLASYGAALAPGDKFVIFRQLDGITPLPVTGGATMTVSAPGVTSFVNNLATDGSVTVSAVTAPGTETLTATLSGGNVNLSWPAAWTGLHVQVQNDTLGQGLGTNWVTIPGSDASNSYSVPVVKTPGSVFYRLAP